MGRTVSFNRLASLRNEIFDLGGFFVRRESTVSSTLGEQLSDSGKVGNRGSFNFRSNREMLDFLWHLRGRTYEACCERGLTPGWWSHLQNLYSEWEFVRNSLAAQYMPLVKSIAQKYGHPNQDFADLVQEGAKGMLRALDSFEVEYGVPFEAYARPWIRKYLGKCVECDSEVVRIPESFARRRRARHIAGCGNLSAIQKECCFESLENCELDVALSFSNASSEASSCDSALVSGEVNPEERFCHRETVRFLNQCVNSLDETSQKVLQLHYCGAVRPSLEEVGEKCGFSREKTRKIEKKALEKLAKQLECGRKRP